MRRLRAFTPLVFFSIFLTTTIANAETTFDLVPLAEIVQGTTQTQAERGLLETKFHYKDQWAIINIDAFAMGDLAQTVPDTLNDRYVAFLQEAYLEVHPGENFNLKIGQMPVRWSESWTIPSLDIWTGRRWNQLFELPVAYQLVHPVGMLITNDNGTTTIAGFLNIIPAQDIYPPGVPPPPNPLSGTNTPEYGVRFKTRLAGFDFSAIAAQQQTQNVYGGNVSYALNWAVPKVEAGVNSRNDKFATGGLDIFLGDWSILPQATVFASNSLPTEYQRLFYLPVRYSTESNSVEAQAYDNLDSGDQFYSLLYTHNFQNGLQLTGYVQNYLGDTGTLFGFYQTVTDGPVFGLRVADDFSF